jgi:hypothetical protein
MVGLYELQCTAPSCDRGDGASYKTTKLEAALAVILLKKHRAEWHPPAAPPNAPSCTPLTDSVNLPAVPSTAAEDSYGLFTKSPPSPPDKRRQLSSPPDKRRQPSSQAQ